MPLVLEEAALRSWQRLVESCDANAEEVFEMERRQEWQPDTMSRAFPRKNFFRLDIPGRVSILPRIIR